MRAGRFLDTRLSLAAAVVIAMGAAAPARAQPRGDANRGLRLFNEGTVALEKGDYPTACAKFTESLKIAARPNLLLNLAQCEEHEGRLVDARKHWQEGQSLIDTPDERVGRAREHVAALDKRIPKVTVRIAAGAPPGAAVGIDGVDVAPQVLAAPIPLDPGSHVFTLVASGSTAARVELRLAESETREVLLAPGAPVAAAPAAPQPVAESKPPPTDSKKRTIGFVVGGVGLAGVGVAAVTGAMLLSRDATIKKECPNKVCSPAGLREIQGQDPLIAVNYVAWGVGAAGLAVGAFLVLTSSSGNSAPATTAIGATAIPQGAAFHFERRF